MNYVNEKDSGNRRLPAHAGNATHSSYAFAARHRVVSLFDTMIAANQIESQPVNMWPRLIKTESATGSIEYQIVKIKE